MYYRYHTNVVLIKTYKLRIYDMFHFSGSTAHLTRSDISKKFLRRVPSFETFLDVISSGCGNSKANLKPNEEKLLYGSKGACPLNNF